MEKEQSIYVELKNLKQFSEYTFKLHEGAEMDELVESINERGIITPIIVRRIENGYEIISGHRRVHAARIIGYTKVPAIVKEVDTDEAVILMVDSNMTREYLLPSEKAFSYKAKLEAIKRQGKRNDLTLCQDGKKFNAGEIIAAEAKESSRNIHRYIRLTYLIPELLKKVDDVQISINPAVELSYLRGKEQVDFCSAMEYAGCAPSLSQAQRLRRLSKDNIATIDKMIEIMSEEKKVTSEKVVLKYDDVRKYFLQNYSTREIKKLFFDS